MSFSDIFKGLQYKSELESLRKEYVRVNAELDHQKEVERTQAKRIGELYDKLQALGSDQYDEVQSLIKSLNESTEEKNNTIEALKQEINSLNVEKLSIENENAKARKKLFKIRDLFDRANYCIENFQTYELEQVKESPESDKEEMEELLPSVILKLHCMDIKELNKAFRSNDRQITKLTRDYSKRYQTKTNRTIYSLMTIALRAELQNILYDLKYEKLDKGVEKVKAVTAKYLQIATDGNQQIAGTITKFIGEIEYLFINAVKIEYNYYVKKEQAKQEQIAIREQMKQEAAERKALELEKKRVESEERKFQNEIAKLNEQVASSVEDDEETAKLKARILELQSQLSDVVLQKDKISELANGRAGNVYVISNLGSFGENMFKIGMTRRLNPQDRVDELGNASVPFKFDVHSFIFSNDAVGLEGKLHEILDSKRVNKVNRRKEFFNTTIDELEQLVMEIEPTAEFNKTMAAEEFRQSQSSDGTYSDDFVPESDEVYTIL